MMPSAKALEKARIDGYVASGHNQPFTKNPYFRSKAAAFRNAWNKGWFQFQFDHMPETAIECDNCKEEAMYPVRLNGKDVWQCRSCWFIVPNLELQEMVAE